MLDKCTCNEKLCESHTCPFKEEINNDSESTCTCCEYCTKQCEYCIQECQEDI